MKLSQARAARERAAAKQRLRVNMLQCVFTVRATIRGSTLEQAYEHTARVWLHPFNDLRTVAKRAVSPTTLTSVAKAVKDMYYRWKTMRSVSPLVYKRASVSDFLVGDATIHAELVAWVLKQLLKKRSGVDPFVVPVNAPLGSGARARAGVGAGALAGNGTVPDGDDGDVGAGAGAGPGAGPVAGPVALPVLQKPVTPKQAAAQLKAQQKSAAKAAVREEKAAHKAAKAARKPKPVQRVLSAEKQAAKDAKVVKAAEEKASRQLAKAGLATAKADGISYLK